MDRELTQIVLGDGGVLLLGCSGKAESPLGLSAAANAVGVALTAEAAAAADSKLVSAQELLPENLYAAFFQAGTAPGPPTQG